MNLDSLLTLAVGTRKLPHIFGIVDNRVIAPGESIKLIEVTDSLWAERLYHEIMLKGELQYSINYESIYGQQWVSTGYHVNRID